jgi:amidase
VALAHTNGAGGSIRLPASARGLGGRRSTRGRVTLGPDVGDRASGALAEFVVTRSVRDTGTMLDPIGGNRDRPTNLERGVVKVGARPRGRAAR